MTQPNVIVVVSDQLRPFELGCYGHPTVQTPNIDRLAAEGVRFETAISPNPICSPARSCLMSGQYSRTCTGIRGCVGDPGPYRSHMPDTTLPEAFAAAGYDTATIGKWHMGSPPNQIGFDHWVYSACHHRNRDRLFFDNSTEGRVVPGWTWDFEQHRTDKYFASREGRPFLMYFNIEPPHMPLLQVPKKYLDMYGRDDVQLRPNVFVDGEMAYNEEWFRIYRWDHLYMLEKQPHTIPLPDDFDLIELHRLYYGNVTLVDDRVGLLMESLRKHGLADNTIVLFTADHGDALGSHHCWNKIRLSEESIRVPMIIHAPGRLEPRRYEDRMMNLIDVMPTLLHLAGIEAPDCVQGRDALIEDTPIRETFIETLYSDFTPNHENGVRSSGGIAIRTQDHLLSMTLRNPSTYAYAPENDEIINDESLFFDLREDPYEMTNLAGAQTQRQIAATMRERLKHWHDAIPWMDRCNAHRYSGKIL